MGLYLVVFADDTTDEELLGVEVGTYADFDTFRSAISDALGEQASSYPTLLAHPDSGTPWSPADAHRLVEELEQLAEVLAARPAHRHEAGSWQPRAMEVTGLRPRTLWESFVDVDGEVLLTQITRLAALAVGTGRPVEFL